MKRMLILFLGTVLAASLLGVPDASGNTKNGGTHTAIPDAIDGPVQTDCEVTGFVDIAPGVVQHATHNTFAFNDVVINCTTGTGAGTYDVVADGSSDGLTLVGASVDPDVCANVPPDDPKSAPPSGKTSCHGEDLTQGWGGGDIVATAGTRICAGTFEFHRGWRQAADMNIRTLQGGDVQVWGRLVCNEAALGTQCFRAALGIIPTSVSTTVPPRINQGFLAGAAHLWSAGKGSTFDKTGGNAGTNCGV